MPLLTQITKASHQPRYKLLFGFVINELPAKSPSSTKYNHEPNMPNEEYEMQVAHDFMSPQKDKYGW